MHAVVQGVKRWWQTVVIVVHFGRGFVTRADKKVHIGEYFDQGRGRIVLTASDSMQYSFEENKLQVEVNDPGQSLRVL